MPVYRPSCVVNFRIRFDEAFQDPAFDKSPDPVEVDEQAKKGGGSSRVSELPKLLQGTKDDLSFVFGVVPMKMTAELPGYRLAGKWNIEMPFRDFPFDPRVLRACGVEVHLGCVTDDDFAEGMTGKAPKGELRRSHIRTREASGRIRQDTLVLIGVMDTVTVTHGQNGSVICMEGRDLRSILLDTPMRPSVLKKLDLTKPIDLVVRQLLNSHPQGQRITVSVQAGDWDANIPPSPAVKGDLTRWQLGANGLLPRTTFNADPHSLNFWDVITKYCYLVGGVPYFSGEELRIRRARSLFDLAAQKAWDPDQRTPFPNNSQRSIKGEKGSFETPIRVMAYGRNIAELKFERKMAGPKVPVVECVCVDSSSDKKGFEARLLVARWPDVVNRNKFGKAVKGGKLGKAKTTVVAPSGEATMTDVMRIPVPGIRSVDRLREIARDIFEEVGRGEMGGSCATKDMASLGAGAEEPDLVRIRPGDAVRFTVDARQLSSYPPVVAELVEQQRKTTSELADDLTKRLGDRKMAEVLAGAVSAANDRLPTIFRVSNVKYSWDAKSGLGVEFDFQNYVESRSKIGDADNGSTPNSKPQKNASGDQ